MNGLTGAVFSCFCRVGNVLWAAAANMNGLFVSEAEDEFYYVCDFPYAKKQKKNMFRRAEQHNGKIYFFPISEEYPFICVFDPEAREFLGKYELNRESMNSCGKYRYQREKYSLWFLRQNDASKLFCFDMEKEKLSFIEVPETILRAASRGGEKTFTKDISFFRDTVWLPIGEMLCGYHINTESFELYDFLRKIDSLYEKGISLMSSDGEKLWMLDKKGTCIFKWDGAGEPEIVHIAHKGKEDSPFTDMLNYYGKLFLMPTTGKEILIVSKQDGLVNSIPVLKGNGEVVGCFLKEPFIEGKIAYLVNHEATVTLLNMETEQLSAFLPKIYNMSESEYAEHRFDFSGGEMAFEHDINDLMAFFVAVRRA